ncbi:MAG: hypothetical protein JWR37_2964 [Mycobacterium sp.]|nr:hypothetical protein [Mycobacterium sp.]
MFQDLVTAATAAARADGIIAWARVENAACANRLAATADLIERRMAADGSAEREQWRLDNWEAIAAEVAAAQTITLGTASNQMVHALALRDQLPRVAGVFAAGAVTYRLIMAIVARTMLIKDPDAMAKVDTELAAHIIGWEALSAMKTEQAIDYWVNRYDPGALRRTEVKARSRHVDVSPPDGTGVTPIWAMLFDHDAAVLDRRLDAMARAVCSDDTRTLDQRRADALGALAAGQQRLACLCGGPHCPVADSGPHPSVVIHVLAEAETLSTATDVELNGADHERMTAAQLRETPLLQALAPPAGKGPLQVKPGFVVGRGVLPAPVVAMMARQATIRPMVHPGNAPPEPRYRPSATLEAFIRCRDLTCRFPGCDQPAHHCDIDHTVPYPFGSTHASNLKCLCRKHHLLKTFWSGVDGWRDRQMPDGAVIWTAPGGRTYTTRPGSRLLFPTLTEPTAPVSEHAAGPEGNRGLMMPRRKRTRAQDRQQRIDAERTLNSDEPPPF